MGAQQHRERNAAASPRPGSRTRANATPRAIVSGRPTTSSRDGRLAVPRIERMSMRDASVNRHRTSAISPTRRSSSLARSPAVTSVEARPRRSPAARLTICGVTLHVPSDRDTSAYPNRTAANSPTISMRIDSAEREAVRLDTGVKELDLEQPIPDRS